ncbi:MAG: hypothetical protein ABMA15_14415 [Vicinamibacterales bacterium]
MSAIDLFVFDQSGRRLPAHFRPLSRQKVTELPEGSSMDFDPRDTDSRDDDRYGHNREEARWDERDRDDRERSFDPRDVFTRDMNLPRGLEREIVRHRDREYTLRGSESHTLTTVGSCQPGRLCVDRAEFNSWYAWREQRRDSNCSIGAKRYLHEQLQEAAFLVCRSPAVCVSEVAVNTVKSDMSASLAQLVFKRDHVVTDSNDQPIVIDGFAQGALGSRLKPDGVANGFGKLVPVHDF